MINIWFVASIIFEVVSSFLLWIWLRKRGVRLVFGLSGIPGYLERFYIDWCRSHGHPYKRVLVTRVISVINLIVAAIVFIVTS